MPDLAVITPNRKDRLIAANQKLITAFLLWHRCEKNSAPLTIEAYASDLKQFSEFLGERSITAIGRKEIGEYHVQLIDRVKPRAAARKLCVVRNLFRFLFRDGYIKYDLSVSIVMPKWEKKMPNHLEPSEIDAILPIVPEGREELTLRNRAILELLYGAGLRASEVVTAKLSLVDFSRGLIVVRGKGNKERVVPLRGRAAQALKDYLEMREEASGWLFTSKEGEAITRQMLWKIVNKCSALIGRQVYPHMFRHTFGTHLVENGADMRTVQTLLGHAEIDTTEIYTHVKPGWVRKQYFEHHPRATGKTGQMKLQLEMVSRRQNSHD